MAEHNTLGKRGEEVAIKFLRQNKYIILDTAWHFNHKEVDIIAKDNDVIVFIEVKTRTTKYWGNPEEFVTKQKQRFLIQAAEKYVTNLNHNGDVRFDVISILFENFEFTVEHIIDAFYPQI
jgi:putative endonuclease